jgi:hypothetical protein
VGAGLVLAWWQQRPVACVTGGVTSCCDYHGAGTWQGMAVSSG